MPIECSIQQKMFTVCLCFLFSFVQDCINEPPVNEDLSTEKNNEPSFSFTEALKTVTTVSTTEHVSSQSQSLNTGNDQVVSTDQLLLQTSTPSINDSTKPLHEHDMCSSTVTEDSSSVTTMEAVTQSTESHNIISQPSFKQDMCSSTMTEESGTVVTAMDDVTQSTESAGIISQPLCKQDMCSSTMTEESGTVVTAMDDVTQSIESANIISQPWLDMKGQVNLEMLKSLLYVVASAIIKRPGITQVS